MIDRLAAFETALKAGITIIDLGTPCFSDSDRHMLLSLIAENRIPEGVTVKITTLPGENNLRRSVDALKGLKHAIIDLVVPFDDPDTVLLSSILLKKLAAASDVDISVSVTPAESAILGEAGSLNESKGTEETRGICHLLRENFGFIIPEQMKVDLTATVKEKIGSDVSHMVPDRLRRIFESEYVKEHSFFSLPETHFEQRDGITAHVTVYRNSRSTLVIASGNGRLDATSNAIKQFFKLDYDLKVYEEHALTQGTTSLAASYVGLDDGRRMYWGVGVDADIIKASVAALTVAVNHILKAAESVSEMDSQLVGVLNYIHDNYLTVTLDELSERFHLTKPYLSKYIKEKTGNTFGDIVKDLKMKKAAALLKTTTLSAGEIADRSGYPTIEHFNRTFKKYYGMSPNKYRKQA